MSEVEWGAASLLMLVAEWPSKHQGRYIDLATMLSGTGTQSPRTTATHIKALGDEDLIRVRGAVDLELVGLSRSKVLLRDFKTTVMALEAREQNWDHVVHAFRKEAVGLAGRQLAVTGECAAPGKLRHGTRLRYALAA